MTNIPLRILVVSDHKCNGLGGQWYLGQEVVDRFFNLVLSLTKSKKQQQVIEDGERGLGRTATVRWYLPLVPASGQ